MNYYVEVVYLLRGYYQKRKYIPYNKIEDATKIYDATVLKFKKENTKALVCLRQASHGLIKSEST